MVQILLSNYQLSPCRIGNCILMSKLRSILLLLSVFAVNSALATPIYIDFTSSPDAVEEDLTFEESGVTLTITAWTTSFDSDQNQLEPWQLVGNGFGVSVRDNGIGVKSSADDGSTIDGGASSNYADDPDEGLLLQFSELVNIHDFVISSLSDSDDINFSYVSFISPTQITTNDIFLDAVPAFTPENLYNLPNNIIGDSFMIWVDGRSDGVRLADIAFTRVPAPATWLMMALPLLLLRWFKPSNK